MSLADFSWLSPDAQQWIPGRTIFLTKAGSHAYGTNLPTSDIDIRGVCIAPKEYYFGYLRTFEDHEHKSRKDVPDDPDAVIYEIRKYVMLAADCNPNIIEQLFTDQADWLIDSPTWRELYEHRELFLSQNAQHRFSGYAFSQLKRIKTHRAWLLNPPKKKPERADFGLPDAPTVERTQLGFFEARVKKIEDALGGQGWTKDKVEERDAELVTIVAGEVNLAPALIPIIIAERKYNSASRNWASYQKWKADRNSVRSELEAKFGYDTKHAMHLVRLLRMAVEIMSVGKVFVKRPDAEDLLGIRRGAWKFDDLMAWAERMEKTLKEVAATTQLPYEPDRVKIDDLLIRIVEDYFDPGERM